jgi:hypothetical protein
MKSFVNSTIRSVSTKYLAPYLGWLRALRYAAYDLGRLIEQALPPSRRLKPLFGSSRPTIGRERIVRSYAGWTAARL